MPAAGDIFLVSAFGRCLAQRIILTQTYRLSTYPVGVTDLECQQALMNWVAGAPGQNDGLETVYRQCLPTNYTLEEWHVQKISPFRVRVNIQTRNQGGLVAGEAQTANVAGVITLKTDLAGRSQVANKHIGPLAQDEAYQSYTSGNLSAGMLALFGDLRDQLQAEAAPGPSGWLFLPVIYHRALAPLQNATPITTGVVQQTVRVMRRRTLGVGV
jgi:hypothetical protein